MRTTTTKIWVEGTILAALAMVLSYIPLGIGSSYSISLGQIPLAIYALRRGPKAGLLAGLVWGLLHFPLGQVYFLSVAQVLIEYPLAFTFAGLTGVTAVKLQQALVKGDEKTVRGQIVSGVFIGVLARYFWHFIAGWIFWGEYAFGGMSPVVFSLVMNGASGLSTGICTVIVLIILYKKFPAIFVPKDAQIEFSTK